MGGGVLVVALHAKQWNHERLIAVHRDRKGADGGLGLKQVELLAVLEFAVDPVDRLDLIGERVAKGRLGQLRRSGAFTFVATGGHQAPADVGGPPRARVRAVHRSAGDAQVGLLQEHVQVFPLDGAEQLQPLDPYAGEAGAPFPASELPKGAFVHQDHRP